MDTGAWRATVHGNAKESDMTERLSTHVVVINNNNVLPGILQESLPRECHIHSEPQCPSSVQQGITKILFVTESVMNTLADTTTPYGIVAVCKIPSAEFKAPTGNALLLDGIADPGNVGTIFRTAAACDFKDVYLVDSVDVYSPKVVRATLGGLFKVNACEIDAETAKRLIKESNSAVLDMDGKNILKENIKSPVLFVAGNEAHGVRDEFKRVARTVYSLPMKNGVESLNVAVATSVAMYRTI